MNFWHICNKSQTTEFLIGSQSITVFAHGTLQTNSHSDQLPHVFLTYSIITLPKIRSWFTGSIPYMYSDLIVCLKPDKNRLVWKSCVKYLPASTGRGVLGLKNSLRGLLYSLKSEQKLMYWWGVALLNIFYFPYETSSKKYNNWHIIMGDEAHNCICIDNAIWYRIL